MNEPRRVVQVVRSDSFAGVERYICDVSAELVQRGWLVDVVGGDPTQMLRELPAGVHHSAAARTKDVARVLVSLGRLPLVHAHMTAAELAAVVSRPVHHAPIVATRHFAGPRGRTPLASLAGRILARGLVRELAISEFVAASIPGAPVLVRNGVRTAADRTRRDDGSCILVMQRLQPEKDTATAVHAFALSGLSASGWRLTIAGRGVLAESLRALVDELGLDNSVEFLGFVADPTAARGKADIFLATAPAEPFGLSLAEAMAEGLPVVAAAGGGHVELVGDAGLLFAPGDAAACAVQLRRLAASQGERVRLGRAARERQMSLFDLGDHVNTLERVYHAVLRGTPTL